MSSLAISRRSKPKRRQTMSCCRVATVIAQAPSSICRRKSWGAMVVLPWGAMESLLASMKARIQRLLCSRAERLSTARGKGRSPRSRFQPCRPTAPSSIFPARGGMPLMAAVRVWAARASKASLWGPAARFIRECSLTESAVNLQYPNSCRPDAWAALPAPMPPRPAPRRSCSYRHGCGRHRRPGHIPHRCRPFPAPPRSDRRDG